MKPPLDPNILRPHFALDPDGVFLNHGSFGAPPKVVREAQDAVRADMERQPDLFFREVAKPLVRGAADKLARFLGASPGTLAFVNNVSEGASTILAGIEWKPGDEILVTTHGYAAVTKAAAIAAKRFGLTLRSAVLPANPADEAEVTAAILGAAGPKTRLALIDHVTSPSGVILPVQEIVAGFRARGILTLIDGAHGPGMVPVDLTSLAADWYLGNAHKWLFGPRGAGFIQADPRVAAQTLPLTISHDHEKGFPAAFDLLGTRDPSAGIVVPAALGFIEHLGGSAVIQRFLKDQLLRGSRLISETLGVEPVWSERFAGAMRAFILPGRGPATHDEAHAFQARLWHRHKIQAVATLIGDRLALRLSAQVYVRDEDYAKLAAVLKGDKGD